MKRKSINVVVLYFPSVWLQPYDTYLGNVSPISFMHTHTVKAAGHVYAWHAVKKLFLFYRTTETPTSKYLKVHNIKREDVHF